MKKIASLFQHFLAVNPFEKGAAMAYYTVFSLIPMGVIIVMILGAVFGESAVKGELYESLHTIIGTDGATQVQSLIQKQYASQSKGTTAIIGFVTLALSATGMFIQLHNSFNEIWHIEGKPKNGLINFISKHFVSFVILISLFFLVLSSASAHTVLTKYLPASENANGLFVVIEHLSSYLLMSLSFFLIFKHIGDAKVHWKMALMGGFFTSILFILGKIGIGFYLSKSNITSTFGAGSVMAILMLWVYYTSQLLFIGASFVYLISEKYGHPVVPSKIIVPKQTST